MYGYLRLLRGTTPPSVQRYYRNNYCSLCHSLWQYYGTIARFILSYDMTFMSVVLDMNAFADLDDRYICYRRANVPKDGDHWKCLAAMSVLLASKKLEDDINDDNDFKAKLALSVISKAALKAEDDYPELGAVFRNGFSEMSSMERENADIFSLSKKFGQIMTDAVNLLFCCTASDIAVVRHVTEWVYFIDALDDLEKDVKEGDFNPFKSKSYSKRDLIRNHSSYLEKYISEQQNRIKPYIDDYSKGTPRNWIIVNTLFGTIPIVTERVMRGEKPYQQPSLIIKYLEMRGGYRLA